MAKSYKVAVMGNDSSQEYWGYGIGLKVFDLTVDQICSLLEKPDINDGIDHAKLGAQPCLTYAVQGGGRFFPSVSREEIARVMQGVEIFIAMLAASPSFNNFMSVDFYTCLTEDNLLDQCATIVARIVDGSTGTSRRGRRNRTGNDTNSTLKMYRLDSEKFKDKLRVIADPSVKVSKKQKKLKKGDKSEGVSGDLTRLRAALLGEELRERVIQPVKETLSAGKMLMGAGQRLSRWIGSLVKTA